MTSSSAKSGATSKKRIKRAPKSGNNISTTQKYAGEISETREAEIKYEYVSKGWHHIDGLITLGFVSRCGEYFNCYCKKTGHFYSFGTDEALKLSWKGKQNDRQN